MCGAHFASEPRGNIGFCPEALENPFDESGPNSLAWGGFALLLSSVFRCCYNFVTRI